jgi:cyclophilin family peptidyl-prolyl cis-trans isomerase
MASAGVHTGGSQFYIDLAPAPHLDGRCVVFGRLVEGDDVLQKMEKVLANALAITQP